MTDKQIINDQKNTIHRLQQECREKTNAIIALGEQLKAKEQELQEAMDNYVQLDLQRVKEYNELVDLYKSKEQECEELKETNNTLAVTRDKLLGDLWIEEESLKDYIEHYNKAIDELDQLKQTLADIKEIAEIKQKQSVFVGETVFEQILQKISECEVEE